MAQAEPRKYRSSHIEALHRSGADIVSFFDDKDCGHVEWVDVDSDSPLFRHRVFRIWRRVNGKEATVQRVGNPEIVAAHPTAWALEKDLAKEELFNFSEGLV